MEVVTRTPFIWTSSVITPHMTLAQMILNQTVGPLYSMNTNTLLLVRNLSERVTARHMY